jgi:hypothetical protein
MSLDFPSRPTPPSVVGGRRVSRFSRIVFPHMPESSATSGPAAPHLLAVRRVLPSALRKVPRRLQLIFLFEAQYPRPACAPANASGTSSRACPHSSGSPWVASPSVCEFLLRCTMPVYPGASADGRALASREPLLPRSGAQDVGLATLCSFLLLCSVRREPYSFHNEYEK